MCAWAAVPIRFDLAGWTGSVIQGESILDIARLAPRTNREVKFVIVGDVLQQAPRPFETQLSIFMQQQVSLESAADAMTKFNVRPRPARGYRVVGVNLQQQAAAIQSHEGCCLQLVLWILDEAAYLPWRLATPSSYIRGTGVEKIRRINLADPIVR